VIAWLLIGAIVAFILLAAWLGSRSGETEPKASIGTAYGASGGAIVDYGPLTDDEMAGHEALLREMDQ
jgi:hypothetical protein